MKKGTNSAHNNADDAAAKCIQQWWKGLTSERVPTMRVVEDFVAACVLPTQLPKMAFSDLAEHLYEEERIASSKRLLDRVWQIATLQQHHQIQQQQQQQKQQQRRQSLSSTADSGSVSDNEEGDEMAETEGEEDEDEDVSEEEVSEDEEDNSSCTCCSDIDSDEEEEQRKRQQQQQQQPPSAVASSVPPPIVLSANDFAAAVLFVTHTQEMLEDGLNVFSIEDPQQQQQQQEGQSTATTKRSSSWSDLMAANINVDGSSNVNSSVINNSSNNNLYNSSGSNSLPTPLSRHGSGRFVLNRNGSNSNTTLMFSPSTTPGSSATLSSSATSSAASSSASSSSASSSPAVRTHATLCIAAKAVVAAVSGFCSIAQQGRLSPLTSAIRAVVSASTRFQRLFLSWQRMQVQRIASELINTYVRLEGLWASTPSASARLRLQLVYHQRALRRRLQQIAGEQGFFMLQTALQRIRTNSEMIVTYVLVDPEQQQNGQFPPMMLMKPPPPPPTTTTTTTTATTAPAVEEMTTTTLPSATTTTAAVGGAPTASSSPETHSTATTTNMWCWKPLSSGAATAGTADGSDSFPHNNFHSPSELDDGHSESCASDHMHLLNDDSSVSNVSSRNSSGFGPNSLEAGGAAGASGDAATDDTSIRYINMFGLQTTASPSSSSYSIHDANAADVSPVIYLPADAFAPAGASGGYYYTLEEHSAMHLQPPTPANNNQEQQQQQATVTTTTTTTLPSYSSLPSNLGQMFTTTSLTTDISPIGIDFGFEEEDGWSAAHHHWSFLDGDHLHQLDLLQHPFFLNEMSPCDAVDGDYNANINNSHSSINTLDGSSVSHTSTTSSTSGSSSMGSIPQMGDVSTISSEDGESIWFSPAAATSMPHHPTSAAAAALVAATAGGNKNNRSSSSTPIPPSSENEAPADASGTTAPPPTAPSLDSIPTSFASSLDGPHAWPWPAAERVCSGTAIPSVSSQSCTLPYPLSATLAFGVFPLHSSAGVGGIVNEHILHAILVDSQFQIPRPAYGTAACGGLAPGSPMMKCDIDRADALRVRWTAIFNEFSAIAKGEAREAPLMIEQLTNVRNMILSVTPNAKRDRVYEFLDPDLVRQSLAAQCFTWGEVVALVRTMMALLQDSRRSDAVSLTAWEVLFTELVAAFHQSIDEQRTVMAKALFHIEDEVNLRRVLLVNEHVASLTGRLQDSIIAYEMNRFNLRLEEVAALVARSTVLSSSVMTTSAVPQASSSTVVESNGAMALREAVIARYRIYGAIQRQQKELLANHEHNLMPFAYLWMREAARRAVAEGISCPLQLLNGDKLAVSNLHAHAVVDLIQSPLPLFRSTLPETLREDSFELAALSIRFQLHVALAAGFTVLSSFISSTLSESQQMTAAVTVCAHAAQPVVDPLNAPSIACLFAAALSASCPGIVIPEELLRTTIVAASPGTALNELIRTRVASMWSSVVVGGASAFRLILPTTCRAISADVIGFASRLRRIVTANFSVHGSRYEKMVQFVSLLEVSRSDSPFAAATMEAAALSQQPISTLPILSTTSSSWSQQQAAPSSASSNARFSLTATLPPPPPPPPTCATPTFSCILPPPTFSTGGASRRRSDSNCSTASASSFSSACSSSHRGSISSASGSRFPTASSITSRPINSPSSRSATSSSRKRSGKKRSPSSFSPTSSSMSPPSSTTSPLSASLQQTPGSSSRSRSGSASSSSGRIRRSRSAKSRSSSSTTTTTTTTASVAKSTAIAMQQQQPPQPETPVEVLRL